MFSLSKLFGGKPWFKSLVGWAMFVLVMGETAVPALSSMGVISPEIAATIGGYIIKVTAGLAAVGIRRRLPGSD